MKIKLFTKTDCPKCPLAKELCKELENDIEVEYWNVDERDGLAEGSFYEVMSTPTIVIVNDEREVRSFRGEVPDKEEVLKILQNGN